MGHPARALADTGPMATIDLTVNGEGYREEVPDHWTLLDLLRDRL